MYAVFQLSGGIAWILKMEYISIDVNQHHIYKPACTIATKIKSLVRITFKVVGAGRNNLPLEMVHKNTRSLGNITN